MYSLLLAVIYLIFMSLALPDSLLGSGRSISESVEFDLDLSEGR